jgi:hypothetical protein
VGGLTLQTGSAGIFELLNTPGVHAPGAGNDLIDVVGALTAFSGSNVTFDVDAIGGGDLSNNGSWTLALYDSLAGTGLPTFNITGIDPGLTATVLVVPDDAMNAPLGAGAVVLTVVPEPSSFVLAWCGLIGLTMVGKRRRK